MDDGGVIGCMAPYYYFQFWKTSRWQWLAGWTIVSIFAVMHLLTTSYDRISTTEHAAYTLYTDDLMPWRVLSIFLCGVYEHGSLVRSNDAIMASLLLMTVEREYFSKPQKQSWRLAGESIRKHSSAGDVWLHQSTPRAFASEYQPKIFEILKNFFIGVSGIGPDRF